MTIVIGAVLVVFASIMRRRPRNALIDWLTLRVGQASFVEIAGAFLIGFGIGQLLAPASPRVPGAGVVITRFGRGPGGAFDPPLMLGVVAALIDIGLRVDVLGLVVGGRSPNAASRFIGVEARVAEAIPAGGTGRIAVRNVAGEMVSVAATAPIDIPAGTIVQITALQERTFVVAPVRPERPAKAASA